MKKLIYKVIKMFFLALLLVVITVFVMLMLKRFVPQFATVLPFNNELTDFEIQTRMQVDKILKPTNIFILNIKNKFSSQNSEKTPAVDKIFQGIK